MLPPEPLPEPDPPPDPLPEPLPLPPLEPEPDPPDEDESVDPVVPPPQLAKESANASTARKAEASFHENFIILFSQDNDGKDSTRSGDGWWDSGHVPSASG